MAVDGVTFNLLHGETLGLVGESGSGKSLTALSLLRLNPKPASAITGGQVFYRGQDLLQIAESQLRKIRGREISMVLQDPMTSLNPTLRIGEQIYEPLRVHRGMRGKALERRAVELLELLKVPEPRSRLAGYPHEFSGGQRQRVVGAIALSCDPQVLIADEPTTALDVTVQAAYLAHLKEVQRRTQVAILFITHDFSVVARMCDRVAVMYAGKIVESGTTHDVLEAPAHPYTQALLRSVPDLDDKVERLASIEGQPPPLFGRGPGCPFVPRCPLAQERCSKDFPPIHVAGPLHEVHCWEYL